MANIVAGGTLELQSISGGYWFEIPVGGLDSIPAVRGENIVIPGKQGQTYAPKVADHLDVTLHGVVFGTGATPRASYLDKMDALKAIFDPEDNPFTIVVHPTARGVGGGLVTGETATITVEFLRLVGPPATGDEVRVIDLECRCISDPPIWVVGT